MRVLVLGAYGLIGQAVVGRLAAAGHEVVGLGRNTTSARFSHPWVSWREVNIARLTTPGLWWPLLDGVDAVVNASGALQTGLRDDVAAVQGAAMMALFEACGQQAIGKVVQISAPGVRPDARTLFLRSKAEADRALQASTLDWVVLRPALVIGRAAYGGTALIRALAAFPVITPLVQAGAQIRTVGVEDVAQAVEDALSGLIPAGSDLVLAEAKAHTLMDIVIVFRCWLGLRPARVIRLPEWLGAIPATMADVAGWLGWRSPLRSTAIAVLAGGGVTEMPASGRVCPSLDETLARMPATPQDQWFARLWLLKPVIFVLLAVFWIVSGVIGFVRQDAAQAILAGGVVSPNSAYAAVMLGSGADVAVGVAVLFRPFSRLALLAMLVLTLGYMAGSAVLTPLLWADPLGPMVKTLPALGLILVALAILEER